jgi:hypothetical protein
MMLTSRTATLMIQSSVAAAIVSASSRARIRTGERAEAIHHYTSCGRANSIWTWPV